MGQREKERRDIRVGGPERRSGGEARSPGNVFDKEDGPCERGRQGEINRLLTSLEFIVQKVLWKNLGSQEMDGIVLFVE